MWKGFMVAKMVVTRGFNGLHRAPAVGSDWPLSRLFCDLTATRLSDLPFFGGTNEIMKEIIGRSLGL
jgi:alkylation response protein AidB-like acyl-CoA dehydrogenase